MCMTYPLAANLLHGTGALPRATGPQARPPTCHGAPWRCKNGRPSAGCSYHLCTLLQIKQLNGCRIKYHAVPCSQLVPCVSLRHAPARAALSARVNFVANVSQWSSSAWGTSNFVVLHAWWTACLYCQWTIYWVHPIYCTWPCKQ